MSAPRNLGPRFWAESVLALVTGFLTILTLLWRDWVEGAFGFDPDQHNGSFEWVLVGVCAVATVIFGLLARREWRRAALVSAR